MSEPTKELPEDITLITENLDNIPTGTFGQWLWEPLPEWLYRDFIEQRLREAGDEAVVDTYLAKSPDRIMAEIRRFGAINLGGRCWAIKCPVSRPLGVCAIAPVEFRGGPKSVCSGPTVEETWPRLLRGPRTVYKRRSPKTQCPYAFDRFTDDFDRDYLQEMLETIYPVVKRHDEYDVVNMKEKYADRSTLWED